jgi:hypothetical protein
MPTVTKQAVVEIEDKLDGKKYVISSINYNGGEVQVATETDDVALPGFLGENQDTFTQPSFYVPWTPGAPVTIKDQVNRGLYLIQVKKT